MPAKVLPSRPNLEQLKLQAKELRRAHAAGKRSAAARVCAQHPKWAKRSPAEVLQAHLGVADTQLVIAREYGFASWASLKQRVELVQQLAKFTPHPRFEAAAAALDAGDLPRLRALIKEDLALLHARGYLDPAYEHPYFVGATLLHHVAGNPIRVPLPGNAVEIARFLLESGADVHAATLGPNGGTALGLLITSKQASDAGVSGMLMDVLLAHGAKLDVKRPGALDVPLANHAPKAAEKMIELGARADLLAAAALGRLDLLRECFDERGELADVPKRGGKALVPRDAVGLALLFAYVNGRANAVDALLAKDGNWSMTGVGNGTVLHRAAIEGNLAMVRKLVEAGADVTDRNNPFNATPYSWAHHEKRSEVVAWLEAHAEIDLHDAVCFGLPKHAAARLDEDPARANLRLDQWDLPQSAPLHWTALRKRSALAKLLLERGADANLLAGDGRTPLDCALAAGAKDVAKLLRAHGAKAADAH